MLLWRETRCRNCNNQSEIAHSLYILGGDELPTEEPTSPRLQDDTSFIADAAETAPNTNVLTSGDAEGVSLPGASAVQNPPDSSKNKKEWFSHSFFLTMVVFAMAVAFVNTWIGPDEVFRQSQFANEEPARQKEWLTKLELRLRRAELLMDNRRLKMARNNLSEALFFTGQDDRALAVLHQVMMDDVHVLPWDPRCKKLFDYYQRRNEYREAADLIREMDDRVKTIDVLTGPMDDFYATAIAVNSKLGDTGAVRKYRDKADRWSFFHRRVYEGYGIGREFDEALHQVIAGDIDKACSKLARMTGANPSERNGDVSLDSRYHKKAAIVLAIIPVLQGQQGAEVDRKLDEAQDIAAELNDRWEINRAVIDSLQMAIDRNERRKLSPGSN